MNAKDAYQAVLAEMRKHIAGQDEAMELMFISLVANGHALLEGVPGVAKTTMAKTLANAVQAEFKRVQGTPDLQPNDIIGYTYRDSDNSVKLKKGPVFTNILLVDELNRTQPKTMSALLETLEERQVSIAGQDLKLPNPFMAFATQNPLNIEGTVPLPKVLADRFMVKIDVGYPSMEQEAEMLRIKESEIALDVKKVIDTNAIMQMQNDAKSIMMPDDVVQYITKIVDATRNDIHVVMGASPRADIAFMQCGKAKSLIEGRKEVTISDIKFLAKPVLSHRIAVRATGGIGVKGIIDGIVATLQ